MYELIEKLEQEQTLTRDECIHLLEARTEALAEDLRARAEAVRIRHHGRAVFLRGLIEFTNYCKNDCYYCGIRRSNTHAERYRLTPEQILETCEKGRELGFGTFVLQGGEDPVYTDDVLTELVANIKRRFPDCAITLSVGERSEASYQRLFAAGADRYLLRHETADPAHYAALHPAGLAAKHRQDCLFSLRKIGYQVGAGFMVGTPGQTREHLAEDLLFLQELQPHMIGIGPFIPHHDTPFAAEAPGTLEETLYLLSILRLLFPRAMLPATTALGTIHPRGRELGILAGANVAMPNLSPADVRKKYLLYDGKICTGDEAAECQQCLARRMESIGYHIEAGRGDHPAFRNSEENEHLKAQNG